MRPGRATLRGRTVSAFAMVSLVVSMMAVTAPAATAKTLLVTGLAGGSGSTVGPDGALYVTEGLAGRVSRVDPRTGAVTTFASGLPPSIVGIGGAMDVVFKDGTAYVLVTLVGPDVGGTSVNGIYRVDGTSTFTVIADIGAFAIADPPATAFDVPSGVQYAIDNLGSDFVVTDGHHNRLYRVTVGGTVTQLIQFDNIVPTGLEVRGDRVFVARAGPVPHLPRNGKVVRFRAGSSTATEVASGGRLLVDVEFGADRRFALSQGHFTPGQPPGTPADPDTGRLLRITDGGFTAIAWRLDRPTSFDIIGRTAYVVTLDGEIWKVRLRDDD